MIQLRIQSLWGEPGASPGSPCSFSGEECGERHSYYYKLSLTSQTSIIFSFPCVILQLLCSILTTNRLFRLHTNRRVIGTAYFRRPTSLSVLRSSTRIWGEVNDRRETEKTTAYGRKTRISGTDGRQEFLRPYVENTSIIAPRGKIFAGSGQVAPDEF